MAITERYANFDLASGLNNGTSETDAWQTPAVIVYAAGERVNIKATASRFALTASHSIATAGSATQPVYVREYTSTIGDGGNFLFSTSGSYVWTYTGDNVIAENFDLTSTGSLWITPFNFASDGGLIKNLKAIKSTTGAHTAAVVIIADAAFDNIYAESAGDSSSTIEAVYLNRALGAGVVVKVTAGQGGLRTGQSYRANSLSHVLVFSTVSTTKPGIYIVDAINTNGLSIDYFTVAGFDEGILTEELPTAVVSAMHISNGIISGAVNAITTDDATTRTGITFGNIAFYNNTLDSADMADNVVLNPIALTADPYTTSATGDFRPNNAVGGGRLLRGRTVIGAGMITNNQDIGALQHADPIKPTLAIGL